MPKADPKALAAVARQVDDFAKAIAAGDGPAAAAARAVAVRRWPRVQPYIGGPDPGDADLAADLAAAAERIRAGGVLTKARRFIGGNSPVESDLLARAAKRLSAGGLAAELAELVQDWQADDAVVRLVDLQNRLDSGQGKQLLARLARGAAAHDDTFAPVAEPARTAARTAWLVAADLAAHTADGAVWDPVREWAREWFKAIGAAGELLLTKLPVPAAADGTAQEVCDLTAAPGVRVVLRVRLGPPRPRSPVAVWADLEAPPTWPDAAPPDWLVAFHADARRADADPAGTPPDPAEVKPKFARWVEDAGRGWFHELLADAAMNPAGPAAGWWRQVRAAFWCRAYPDLDPDAAAPAPTWPGDVLLAWPVATSAASARPPGEIVRVERYAATPGLARVVVSDGPSEPDSSADRFHRLYEAVGDREEWWGDGRWAAARENSLSPETAGDRPGTLALGWLDLLAADDDNDARLVALAHWAEGFGLTVVRPADVAAGPRPGLVVRTVFADPTPGAFVRGHGYGLVAGERVLREAVADVSLGRAPAGFEAVEAAAAALPAGHTLRDRAAKLREAVRGNYLMEAAVGLYVDCWAEPGPPAKPTAAFVEALTRFLTANYGLTPFSPASLHDCPDGWVVAVPGSRAGSAAVRKVRRPGLKDEHDNLRIPALVEVE